MGGTKMVAAVVSHDGDIIARDYQLTQASEGPQPVITRIGSMMDSLFASVELVPAELSGIGVACAGAIDMTAGLVTMSPNLPGWHNIPLRDIIRDRYGVNTFLINDASAAALGEKHFGAGRGVKDLIYITVSTGIGGGIIIDDKLYYGARGGTGEIGHMSIDINGPRCRCGNNGCLEVLASGTAVANEAKRRIRTGEKTVLTEITEGNMDSITAEQVGIAAGRQDTLASDIISKAAFYLGIGFTNLVNIFNPEMIIVGGGMARLGDLLLEPVRRAVQEHAFRLSAESVRIVTAELGDNAGVLGAAMYAYHKETC